MGRLGIRNSSLFSLSLSFLLLVCRSQCLCPRSTELGLSLEPSRHRSQPDLYLWATVAGRVYMLSPLESPPLAWARVFI